ncbi:MAG: GNAT family N-acetyltransferase [Gammaproteobacteria bacterium]
MTEYRLMGWAEALATHRAEWLAVGIDRQLNPTLLPDWTEIIAETLADPSTVRVLAGTRDGKLTGLIPFRIRTDRMRGFPVRILEPISSILAYHAEFACQEDPTGLLNALLRSRAELPWEFMRLAGILSDSDTARAIGTVAMENGCGLVRWPGESSPVLPIAATGESLLNGRDKRDRYQIRRHAKDFDATAGSECRWYEDGSDVAGLIQAMLHVEAGSWKQKAGVAISARPTETSYYERLLPWLASTGQLLANVLWINGEPVAYCLCNKWQDRYGCMKGTYREEFARLAVGHHAQDQLILRAADTGALEFDFLGDADPYKLSWSPRTRQHDDYFLYAPSGPGRWLGLAQRLHERLRR